MLDDTRLGRGPQSPSNNSLSPRNTYRGYCFPPFATSQQAFKSHQLINTSFVFSQSRESLGTRCRQGAWIYTPEPGMTAIIMCEDYFRRRNKPNMYQLIMSGAGSLPNTRRRAVLTAMLPALTPGQTEASASQPLAKQPLQGRSSADQPVQESDARNLAPHIHELEEWRKGI